MALSLPTTAAVLPFSMATPFATPAPALELRADATTAALTTTFTPPPSCVADHLTMLTAVSYQIWINEPAPLHNETLRDCYPTEWIGGYSSVESSSSSIAPFMSPLVCPSGWKTQSSTWSSGYIACCASGFTLAAPKTPVDSNRPAYGGTCYSNFDLGQVATVTVYNTTALSTTREWFASTTPAQAYAHPIDGIAADYTPTSSGASTATGTDGSSSASSTKDSAAIRSCGTEAGIVIGLLAAGIVGLGLW